MPPSRTKSCKPTSPGRTTRPKKRTNMKLGLEGDERKNAPLYMDHLRKQQRELGAALTAALAAFTRQERAKRTDGADANANAAADTPKMIWTPTRMGVPKHEWLYGARLVGWPADIPFAAPSKIRSLERARTLVSAVSRGEIHFRRLTDAETVALRVRCDGWEQKEARTAARNDCGDKHKAVKTAYYALDD
ncbi:hypothetical protein PsYK624_074670 [Phanerochaete sordida]|uniref:Uncharacterized protein n=1 Tax=Phanerochaete sordida TaxID=48140 RepID=A0A9P3LEB0_9APHY|nr:hypothetical protein PsYK624_074670 [Phanerochaete sordida]